MASTVAGQEAWVRSSWGPSSGLTLEHGRCRNAHQLTQVTHSPPLTVSSSVTPTVVAYDVVLAVTDHFLVPYEMDSEHEDKFLGK